MTPAQQLALENVAGRALTQGDIDQLDPLLDGNSRNDVAIAALLSVGRTAVAEYWLTDRGLVSDLVKASGSNDLSDAILTKLDALAASSRSTKAMMNRLENDVRGINFGDVELRAQFQVLEQLGVFEATEVAALLALAQKPQAIAIEAVSHALNVAEGRMTL